MRKKTTVRRTTTRRKKAAPAAKPKSTWLQLNETLYINLAAHGAATVSEDGTSILLQPAADRTVHGDDLVALKAALAGE